MASRSLLVRIFVRTAVAVLFFAASSPARAQPADRRVSVSGGYVWRYQDVGAMNGVAADVALPATGKLEVVAEASWAHGTVIASEPFPVGGVPTAARYEAGSTFVTTMAGLRVAGAPRAHPRMRFSAQMLGGIVGTHLSAPISLFNETSFAIQPGIAVELPLFGQIKIRPQADGIIGKLSAIIPNGRRASVLLVMR